MGGCLGVAMASSIGRLVRPRFKIYKSGEEVVGQER